MRTARSAARSRWLVTASVPDSALAMAARLAPSSQARTGAEDSCCCARSARQKARTSSDCGVTSAIVAWSRAASISTSVPRCTPLIRRNRAFTSDSACSGPSPAWADIQVNVGLLTNARSASAARVVSPAVTCASMREAASTIEDRDIASFSG